MPIAAAGAGTGDQTRDYDMQSPNGPGASPSTLAGTETDSDPSGSGAAPGQSDDGLKQAVQNIRSIQVQLMDLARQFPAAAESIRSSATGLRAALRNIIANPGSPEPPSPQVGG